MEHRFTGPSYTLGIEEELMIVDEETLDLSNSIERLLADLDDMPTEGPSPRASRSPSIEFDSSSVSASMIMSSSSMPSV